MKKETLFYWKQHTQTTLFLLEKMIIRKLLLINGCPRQVIQAWRPTRCMIEDWDSKYGSTWRETADNPLDVWWIPLPYSNDTNEACILHLTQSKSRSCRQAYDYLALQSSVSLMTTIWTSYKCIGYNTSSNDCELSYCCQTSNIVFHKIALNAY